MDCAEARLRIEPYVSGTLPDDEKGPLEAHLALCGECRLDSELTKASQREPSGPAPLADPSQPDPGAASADFLEPIHPRMSAEPDPPELDPADHAHPAQPKPPAGPVPVFAPTGSGATGPLAATSGQAEDGRWTLEGVFGTGGTGGTGEIGRSGERGPDTRFEEPETARDLPHPEILSRPVPITRDEPPASHAPAWDFEPADVKGAAKPPQGSLFFAEEALARGTGRRKRKGSSRGVLWGMGALLGIGLLAISVWVAMTIREPLPEPFRAGSTPTEAETTPDVAAPGEADNPSPPDLSFSGEAGTAPSGPGETPVEPSPVLTPPAPPPLAAQPAEKEPPAAAPMAPPPPRSTGQAGTSTTTITTTTARALAPAADRSAPAPIRTSSRTTTTLPPPPPRTSPRTNGSFPATDPESASSASTSSGAPGTTSGATPSPPATTPPAPKPPPAEPPASTGGEALERPIDRLHLATLNAEQNADLAALRKLREAWRGFMKTSIGPDLARAKRELADCLWAVQTLTAKASDQKAALAAYRDYVLNAPAGGADSRTVARMRQLEDAVAERR